VPIYEAGLKELLDRNRANRRVQFSTGGRAGVAHGDVQFIAVGTPPDEDGSADLQYVPAAERNIGRHMGGFKVVVDRSTVPVGTAQRVNDAIASELARRSKRHEVPVVSNPELLKEGAGVNDFMRSHRIVIGSDADERGKFALGQVNAMLASRISFMNELANLADRVGADIESVRRGIGSDPRIGYDFLYAGAGHGGSFFAKDVRALVQNAAGYGQVLRILEAVETVNEEQKEELTNKITARLGADLIDRTFAVWGLAFKPSTDDMQGRRRVASW
jgi:UDPglucose 6-dehydrogenase